MDAPETYNKCDDCENQAGIYICTGCFERNRNCISGLEKAVQIVEARLCTAQAVGYNATYQAALEDVLVFIGAELERQRHPQTASYTTLDIK